jgi:hypothetical protein
VHGCAIGGPKPDSRSNDHLYVTWGLELIKFHVSSVLAKLGARSRTEAVKIGILRGLVAI